MNIELGLQAIYVDHFYPLINSIDKKVRYLFVTNEKGQMPCITNINMWSKFYSYNHLLSVLCCSIISLFKLFTISFRI